MKAIDIGHIVTDPEVLGGEPIIAGHRISVSDVAIWIAYQHEASETIAEEFHLTLGEIYAALAYYYDHKDEIDQSIAETDRLAEEMARNIPTAGVPQEMRSILCPPWMSRRECFGGLGVSASALLL